MERTLTAVRYHEEILTPFIEELHDDELREGLLQQDGATAHCTAETLDFLRTFFDDRIISRNTANDYPPRPCDLTPCDFYLWPRIKNSIFVTLIPTIDELRRRIQQKIDEINENPLELSNVLNSVRRRCVMCVEQQGRHFQQFL
ncbi:hypothetical protein TcasGA2_TC001785 [Tribolium castaneum]|uniref:Tc1-like transposase DDE domain-containing protein n=1 Tax=Tribolium castaneum TaxID=7070 RepID=D7GYB1_TRICA|nr:hypothetical protein TcasGA2_TC001785 [Tribolium castaneum]